jgi:peptidase M28-like protein
VTVDERIETIRELCSFENRLTGTDAERRAAKLVAERLRGQGMRVDVEPTYVHPQMPLVHAAHCALGFVGSLVAIASAPAGFAIVLLASISMYLDVDARFYLLRRLFFRRASQNVLARSDNAGAPARVILSAHLDAARSGMVFNPRQLRLAAALDRALPFPFGPFRILFFALAILLPILGARLAGVDSTALSIVQLVPTLVLLVGIFLLIDVQLSKVVPAANDNASGVATALALAGRLSEDPPRALEVWVLVTGGEEALMEGMRSFLRAHRKELRETETFVVNVDSVGAGELRFTQSEGLAVGVPMGGRLGEICAAIATADRQNGNGFNAEGLAWGFASDAVPVALAGLPVTTITCLEPGGLLPPRYHTAGDVPAAIDPDALARAHDFALELVHRLDADVARRAAR